MANDYAVIEKGLMRNDANDVLRPSVEYLFGPWNSTSDFLAFLGEYFAQTPSESMIPNGTIIGIRQSDGTIQRLEWKKPTGGAGQWVSASSPVSSVNGNTGAVTINKSDVGLGNVDNTSDAAKPISAATQVALNAISGTLVSHTGNTNNPHHVTKDQLGLGNVDNTRDADKVVRGAANDGDDNNIADTYETKIDAQSKITSLASDIADTYQTKSDAANAHSNLQSQLTGISTTVSNLTGLSGTNFGGFSIQQADSLAVAGITTLFGQMGYTAGDTHWFLAGTSMASLKAYRFDGVQTDPVLISSDVYDFTDFSGLQTKVSSYRGNTNDLDSLNTLASAGTYQYISGSRMGLVSVSYDTYHSVATQIWLSDMVPDEVDQNVWNEGPAILMRTYKNGAWTAWSNPLADLKAGLDQLGPKIDEELGYSRKTVAYADITMTKGAVVGSTGADATSDNFYRTPYIDIDGYSKVKFLAYIATTSTHTFGWAFYSSNEASSYISGHRVDVNTSLEDNEQKEYTLDIPSGAKYIRTCIYKDFRTSFYLEATAGTPLKDRVGALEEEFASLPQDLEGTLEGLGDSIEELNGAVANTESLNFSFRIGNTNANSGAPDQSASSKTIRTDCVLLKAGTVVSVDSGYQLKVSIYTSSTASSTTWNSEASKPFNSTLTYTAEEDVYAIIVVRKYPQGDAATVDWAAYAHVSYATTVKDAIKTIESRVTALETPNSDAYNHGPWGLKPSEFDKGYYICGQTQVRTDLGFTTEPNGSGIQECTSVYDDVIGWMDALVALTNVSNTTITKRSIGTSSNNKTLYEYIFTPKRYSVTGFPSKQLPIVLIDACIHGFEKNSFFAWYAFLKDMLTRTDSVQLDAVARNVEIHFVPCSNPYGFDNNSYYNANHVNLNRNFDTTDWESITEGTDQSGYADNPQPFDQPESQAIRDWILTYPKAMMMFTSHTNGRVTNGYDEMNACMTRFGVAGEYFDRLADVIRKHITEQTQQIPRIYNLNIGSAFCGRWQYAESHGGTEVTWVREAAQIPAMTLETFNGLRVDGSYVIGQFSNNSIKCCAEISGNLLLQVLTEYAE